MTYGTVSVFAPGPVTRAVVPLPAGFKWSKGGCPLVLEDAATKVKYKTQWERVRMIGSDVRLCELIAQTRGSKATLYNVVEGRSLDMMPVAGAWAREHFEPPVFKWIDPSGVLRKIITKWDLEYERKGPACVTRRFYGEHVTGWASVYDGLDVIEMDMVLHNAAPCSGPWFFKSFDLDGEDPYMHAWTEPTSTMHLVDPKADGKCWFLSPRATRHFRFACYAGSVQSMIDATDLLNGKGWGVSSAWKTEQAWMPMDLPLPDLPTLYGRMVQECCDQWHDNDYALATGTTIGVGQTKGKPGGRVGLFNCWGSPYGGVTGGSDRELIHTLGVCGALTGRPEAFLALQAELAMSAWRTPIALVDGSTGNSVQLHQWVDSNGKPLGGWSVSGANGEFSQQGKKDGAFGFWNVRLPTLPASEYDAAEWAAYEQYSPHDWQHFVRAWSPALALVMLRNDPLAKWTLRSWSEVFRMSQYTEGDILGEWKAVDNNPEHGTDWGRAQGHGWAMAAATAKIHPKRPEDTPLSQDDTAYGILFEGQMPNGFRRAHVAILKDGPMFFEADGVTPKYAVTTPDEEVYLELAWRALAGMPNATNELARAIWTYGWDSGAVGALSDKLAVRPVSRAAEPFDTCPARNGFDNAEVGLVFALDLFSAAPYLTPTHPALVKFCGGPDPLKALLSRTWTKLVIDDTVFLIAALQHKVTP